MKQKALAGLLGVTLLGMGTVAWNLRDARATLAGATPGWEVADLKTLGAQRQLLEEQHQRIKSRAEAKRKLVQRFLAGSVDTERMVEGLVQLNRVSKGTLAKLATHYPNSSERDIAIWHAVGLVEGELEASRCDLNTKLQAEAWLMEQGLVPSLAW